MIARGDDVPGLHVNLQRARALYDCGSLAEAQALYAEIVRADPRHYESLHLLGVIAMRQGDPAAAVELLGRAIAVEPRRAAAYCNRGLAHERLGRREAALADYDSAIALEPRFGGGHFNRAKLQRTLGRLEDAVAGFEAVSALDPGFAPAHHQRGQAQWHLGRWEDALSSFERALALEPRNTDALCDLGAVLVKLGRDPEALHSFDAAIAVDAAHVEAHCNRGRLLRRQQRWQAALDSVDRALAADPGYAPAHLDRGLALADLGRWPEALDSYDRAIALDGNLAEAHFNRGNLLERFKRPQAAIASYDRALAINPGLAFLRGQRRHAKMQLCDWQGFQSDLAELSDGIGRGEALSPPFGFLALSGSAPLQRQAAEIWVRERQLSAAPRPARPVPVGPGDRRRPEKIKLGYFSADFHDHPVSALTALLFETHDRSRFEAIAFSFGPGRQDAMRVRLQQAFDQFIDVQRHSDADIARLARRMELDIAVDLGGYTLGSRPGIFAMGAAPLQVNFLGYPGTMGAPFMDYLIADRTLVPPVQRRHYTEKILHLPSYQPNDSTRAVADGAADRHAQGLPAAGFVYCCFNSSYKITPPVFDIWMRILSLVPDSVLWLRSGDHDTIANLRREARARGIAPERLRFAARVEAMRDHLARYRLADLFLDTWPFGAHTTAGDALWAGLPVLTCAGDSLASRMGASLLTSIGLTELITTNAEDYAALAARLAAEPERLAGFKRRLAGEGRAAPLFDIRSYTRNLESGYRAILERQRAGLPPEDIRIDAAAALEQSRRSGGDQDRHFDR